MSDERQQATTWQALWLLVAPDRGRYLVLAVVMAVSAAFPLAGPLLVRRMIDRADSASVDELTGLAIAFVVLSLGAQMMAVGAAWVATTAAWNSANRLRGELARHVLGLDHEFHRSHTPGDLIQRIDGDLTSVSDFLGRVVLKVGGGVLLVGGMIAVVGVIDWRLGLAMFGYVSVAAMVGVANRNRAIVEAEAEMGTKAALYGGIEEQLTASEDLRANGAGSFAMARFITDSRACLAATRGLEKAYIKLWALMQTSLTIGLAVSLVVSGLLVARDVISVGTAFLLFQYGLVLRRPLEEIVDQIDVIQRANGAMIRVASLLAVKATIADDGTQKLPAGPHAVRFDNVSFDYEAETDQRVLTKIDFTIEAGQSLGIVGRSGSGKTTIARLLLRLLEPTEGVITLGGIPMQELSQHVLRQTIAMIPQDVQLLAGTVRDNVTLFDPAPSDAEVEEALRSVGMHRLLEAGIHAQIGSGGLGLSAGQKQLLALARVWIRDPQIVVLDEATSRVDPETEERLGAAITALLDGRTAVVIAHRLSTLRTMDQIMVVADGEVIEVGERADLVEQGSAFRRLLELALEEVS